MDRLTVVGIENLQEEIRAIEDKDLDIREQNARIRLIAPVLKTMGFSQDEIDAALVSSCRSDMENCGRCALGLKFLRLAGMTIPKYIGRR